MKNKNWLVLLGLGIFVLVVIYLVILFSSGRTSIFGRASGQGVLSSTNSYVFASPLLAKVGGEKIRVTVFALDGQGKGISGKKVAINCIEPDNCLSLGLVVENVQPDTDTLGRGIFDISSTSVGQFKLQAKVEEVVIPQTVTVTFQ